MNQLGFARMKKNGQPVARLAKFIGRKRPRRAAAIKDRCMTKNLVSHRTRRKGIFAASQKIAEWQLC